LYEKDYRRNNTSKRRLYNDMKRANTPDLTKEQKDQIKVIYDKARSLTEATGIRHHVDHIKPVSKGGLHVPDNLQILIAKENLVKSNKWDEDVPDTEVVKKPIDLTDEEILSLCQSLAKRYRNRDTYDDLVSEGLVACYECRAERKAHKGDYVGAARRAMNDYINIKSKAMSVPKTWASRAVSQALATEEDLEDLDGVKDGTFALLMAAMRNDATSVDETMSMTQGAEVEFEKREFEQYLLSKVRHILSDEDWTFLLMVSDEDTTQAQVADILEISPQAVSLRLKRIQVKASRFVTKSELSIWRE
jgi:RNA polymerase sigma factor (sigma-70 family)